MSEWEVLGWRDIKLAIVQLNGRKLTLTDTVNSSTEAEINNGVVALKLTKYFYG
jgi:hypothetical protein